MMRQETLWACAFCLRQSVLSQIRTWRDRAAKRRQLARFSARDMKDIGLTPSDRWVEVNKPFWRP